MFPQGDDLPIFSGTPQTFIEQPYVPVDHGFKQTMLPGMPGIDYDRVLEHDRQRRRGTQAGESGSIADSGTLWRYDEPPAPASEEMPSEKSARQLREALAVYHLNTKKLRRLVALGADLTEAITSGEPPPEVVYLLAAISALFRPTAREQIKSPIDAAALFMLDMSHLDQEQMRVMCLNTRNQLQKIHLVYQGNVNTTIIRPAELFREPLRLNSVGIILAHNHPSSDPTPSPEDILITRTIVAAGKLLEIDVLDHLVIGQGKWVSMRERKLGFDQ
jgi:RadC-like JAB domain